MSFKVVIYLGLLLPTASSVQPSAGGPRTHFLELASNGVYMANDVTIITVVSYTAFPPLPEKLAVYLCCTILGVTSTGR